MSSPLTEFDSRTMGIYDPLHQINMWGGTFKGSSSLNTGASTVVFVEPPRLDNKEKKVEYASHESFPTSRNDQEMNKPPEKSQRRLAQNREAARKSRLRKKAYVEQLETSRLKLAQLEQELARAKQQGAYSRSVLESNHMGYSGIVNPGIVAAFETEYARWSEEQYKKISYLKNALQTDITDMELRTLVESSLNHYDNLFRMKSDAAKADIFYLMSGMWRTSAERFFLWLGGFRPSELLNVLMPHFQPLTDQQQINVRRLLQSSQQAEDALSQGIQRLQETLSQSIAPDPIGEQNYAYQMASAIEKLEMLENFVNQADHLRQQTLRQMSRILTTRQAARGLLALGQYFHRLHALSSLWAAKQRELNTSFCPDRL